MTTLLFLILLLLSGCAGTALTPVVPVDLPDAAIETSLFLIGDAGSPSSEGDPVLHALTRMASDRPERNLVLFLGDNVYPAGIPDSSSLEFPEAARRLDAQIQAVRSAGCRGIFIPGNHDWARHTEDGWSAVLRQGRIVDGASPALSLLPPGGCPGPSIVDLPGLRLVLIDTQWWLHPGPRPVEPDSDCPEDQPGEITTALKAAIAGAGDRVVIVAGHHPLMSGGEHGGHFTWKDHLFPLRVAAPWLWVPLPVLGSAYPLARKLGYSRQDLSSLVNRRMRNAIEDAFRSTPPLAYVSGHEHNLQVLSGRAAPWYLVSGSGQFDHATHAGSIEGTRFAATESGFMRVDISSGGQARLTVFAVTVDGTAIPIDSRALNTTPEQRADGRKSPTPKRGYEPAPHIRENHARVHFHRPDGRYEGFSLHASDDPAADVDRLPPIAPTGHDHFGLYWDVRVGERAESLRFTIHRAGTIDADPVKILDFSAQGREGWIIEGDKTIFTAMPDVDAAIPGDE